MASMCIEITIMDNCRLKRAVKCIKRRKWKDKKHQGHPPRYCKYF